MQDTTSSRPRLLLGGAGLIFGQAWTLLVIIPGAVSFDRFCTFDAVMLGDFEFVGVRRRRHEA